MVSMNACTSGAWFSDWNLLVPESGKMVGFDENMKEKSIRVVLTREEERVFMMVMYLQLNLMVGGSLRM